MLNGMHIAVLGGGPGNERAVSLKSAEGVAQALREAGARVTPVDVQGPDFALPDDIDIAFNVIHGTFGEDGQLQRILEARGVPYTGARAESSARAFDKILSKKAFLEHGVPTPREEIISLVAGQRPSLPLPLVLKTPREGSSVGVHVIKDEAALETALADLHRFGHEVLVEQFIPARELTVGILDGQALPVVHINPRSGFYDMNNKYPWLGGGGGSDYICPAQIGEAATQAVQAAALQAHRALGIEVYSRVDVLLDAEDRPWVLEANTIPGMTESSLLPKAALAAGISYPELCARIVQISLALK